MATETPTPIRRCPQPPLAPRPARMQARPTHPEMAAQHDRFIALLPELMKSVPGKYVAMRDGQVLAVADDEVSALTAAHRLRPGVMILARLVTDQPIPVERLPILRPAEGAE